VRSSRSSSPSESSTDLDGFVVPDDVVEEEEPSSSSQREPRECTRERLRGARRKRRAALPGGEDESMSSGTECGGPRVRRLKRVCVDVRRERLKSVPEQDALDAAAESGTAYRGVIWRDQILAGAVQVRYLCLMLADLAKYVEDRLRAA
jgi:hypothetical protein